MEIEIQNQNKTIWVPVDFARISKNKSFFEIHISYSYPFQKVNGEESEYSFQVLFVFVTCQMPAGSKYYRIKRYRLLSVFSVYCLHFFSESSLKSPSILMAYKFILLLFKVIGLAKKFGSFWSINYRSSGQFKCWKISLIYFIGSCILTICQNGKNSVNNKYVDF